MLTHPNTEKNAQPSRHYGSNNATSLWNDHVIVFMVNRHKLYPPNIKRIAFIPRASTAAVDQSAEIKNAKNKRKKNGRQGARAVIRMSTDSHPSSKKSNQYKQQPPPSAMYKRQRWPRSTTIDRIQALKNLVVFVFWDKYNNKKRSVSLPCTRL